MFFWTSLSFSQREVPLCSSACPPGGAAVLFVFASSQSFLFLPFLTVLPPFLLSNSMVFHPSWLPSYWFLPMSTSNTESHNAILALIKTPTGFHESFCPDVQELMSPDLWLHTSVAKFRCSSFCSALGGGKEHEGFFGGVGIQGEVKVSVSLCEFAFACTNELCRLCVGVGRGAYAFECVSLKMK